MHRALQLVVLLLLCSGLFAGPAFALSLNEAKAEGLVGEKIDGFVGIVVADPSAEVRELVEQVNRQRRAEVRRGRQGARRAARRRGQDHRREAARAHARRPVRRRRRRPLAAEVRSPRTQVSSTRLN